MQKLLKIGLVVAAVLLTILCVNSISRSVRFSSKKEKREKIVFAKLLCIRDAQLAFYEKNGYYAADFASLVLAINKNDISANCSSDSLEYIPFSNGEIFEMEVGKVARPDGTGNEAFEVKAPFVAYLANLNKDEIGRLQADAISSKQYPGLRVGNETKR